MSSRRSYLGKKRKQPPSHFKKEAIKEEEKSISESPSIPF